MFSTSLQVIKAYKKVIIFFFLGTLLVAVSPLLLREYRWWKMDRTVHIHPNERVVIAFTMAGLGNQFFVYAAAYNLAKRLKAQLWLTEWDKGSKKGDGLARNFALHQYNIDADRYITQEARWRARKHYKTIDVTEENFFDLKPDDATIFMMSGCFENTKYFIDYDADIRSLFKSHLTIEAVELLTEIQTSESVGVHIRRGDVNHDPIPLSYHFYAIERMRSLIKNPRFYIFSDEPEFVTQAFKNVPDVIVASKPYRYFVEEFELFRACKHQIISTSTFGFWAAWLNAYPGKRIISTTHRNGSPNPYGIPSDWIQFDPFLKNLSPVH